MKEIIAKLKADQKVAAALAFIEADRERTLKEQLELVQIPAPSNDERERALHYAEMLRGIGYEVEMDEVNNVYTTIKGTGNGPTVMLAGHLDTVFPRSQSLEIKRDGEKYCVPGINDDTRAISEILSIARALKETGLRPMGDLILCGNVGEEGLGDLRGTRHIFATRSDIDAFVSIDGGKDGSITYGGTGSYRYRVTYSNSGGHSFGAFGMCNPIHALGRAIGEIAKLKPAPQPKTTFNVGVVEGGTSVNSIAYRASMLIDMRSNDPDALNAIEAQVLAILERTIKEENDHWDNNIPVEMKIEKIGNRPAGAQPKEAPIVRIFEAANEACGITTALSAFSSTDCNIPISMGIPAVAIGRGGIGGKTHSNEEWFIPENEFRGPQKDLLGTLAITGVEGVCAPQPLK